MKGDASDIVARLRAVLPVGWFPADAPVLDAVLTGCATAWAWSYDQVAYARAQARRLTASGIFLDLIAADFFGAFLRRRAGETDAPFADRIGRELFREKGTRAGLARALTDLTGKAPVIFEPAYPPDTGGYGRIGMTAGTGLALAGSGSAGAGGWGSLALPFQFFVTAYRPTGGGIPDVAGYYTGSGWAGGGYGVGAIQWVTITDNIGQITDEDIRATILDVIPAASTAWMRVTN